jgi:hypothetical protein
MSDGNFTLMIYSKSIATAGIQVRGPASNRA